MPLSLSARCFLHPPSSPWEHRLSHTFPPCVAGAHGCLVQVYNYLFKINMLMLTAAFAPVLLLMGLMYNPREVGHPPHLPSGLLATTSPGARQCERLNHVSGCCPILPVGAGAQVNVNNMVHMFFSAFTWGYGLTFLSEVRTATHLPLSTTPVDTQLILPPPSPSLPLSQIMAATGIKLSLLKWLDGGIFEANPEIPPIYMPWLWKEHSSTYRPRLTTLLASDVLVNGLLCPVIEEAIKLLVFRVCSRRIRQVRPPSLPA